MRNKTALLRSKPTACAYLWLTSQKQSGVQSMPHTHSNTILGHAYLMVNSNFLCCHKCATLRIYCGYSKCDMSNTALHRI
jgi:hypothetical protein